MDILNPTVFLVIEAQMGVEGYKTGCSWFKREWDDVDLKAVDKVGESIKEMVEAVGDEENGVPLFQQKPQLVGAC